jgi:hypothetical protein
MSIYTLVLPLESKYNSQLWWANNVYDGNTALCDPIYQIYPRGVDILVNNAGELLL